MPPRRSHASGTPTSRRGPVVVVAMGELSLLSGATRPTRGRAPKVGLACGLAGGRRRGPSGCVERDLGPDATEARRVPGLQDQVATRALAADGVQLGERQGQLAFAVSQMAGVGDLGGDDPAQVEHRLSAPKVLGALAAVAPVVGAARVASVPPAPLLGAAD